MKERRFGLLFYAPLLTTSGAIHTQTGGGYKTAAVADITFEHPLFIFHSTSAKTTRLFTKQ